MSRQPLVTTVLTSRLAPKFDDEVAKAVGDGGVLFEVRLAAHVADGPNPLAHPIEFPELTLEGSQHR